MVTVTPGTTAPCSSTLLTRMLPVWICARTGVAAAAKIATSSDVKALLNIVVLPSRIATDT